MLAWTCVISRYFHDLAAAATTTPDLLIPPGSAVPSDLSANRPIRLALVITELALGGAERNFVRLATGLERSRFTVEVVSLKPPPQPPHDELVRVLDAAGIEVRYLNVRRAWQMPAAVAALGRHWKKWQPDIVQSFLFHANTVSALAARLAKVPRLVWGIRVADPNRRRQWIERRLAGRADRIVCVSQEVADFMADETRLDRRKLQVIPNGLDELALQLAEPLPLETLGMAAGRRMLLCVGRLHHQKGFDWLLSFADELLVRLPQHDLVFVGEGPDREALKRMAGRLSAADRIHFAGFRNDVPRCLAAADLLLVPSRWEGLPNVVLEAMAQAKPVVALKTQGVAELLGELVDGQTVAAEPECFLRLVTKLAGDSELAERLGRQNRERALRCFSLSRTLASYCQLYGELARH